MLSRVDPFSAADDAAAWLRGESGVEGVDAALVLGSGWAPAVEHWPAPLASYRLDEVPHFLAPVAEGHLGRVHLHDLDGTRVLVLSGRTHLYEGHGPRAVVHGVRTAAALGAGLLVLTNAGGSLRPDWEIGRPVVIRDHLNLTTVSPVEGARFVDLTDAWSRRLRDLARELARELEPALAEGVYAQLRGPHYNTAAEAEWLHRIGGDLVGMSTVPEAIAARECGLELVGFSTVTSIEGSDQAIDPSEVIASAERTAARLGPLLADLIRRGAPR